VVSDFSWKGRRVLITGASGFVGRWLCRRLIAEKSEVFALVRTSGGKPRFEITGATIVPGDIADSDSIIAITQATKPDSVFHLAANNDNLSTSTSPLPIFETNILGTWSVLEACRVTPDVERIVCASSAEVGSTQASLLAEGSARPRRHPYPVSKLSAELIALAFADTYGMPIAIGRSENVYGGGDANWNRLIPGAIRSILRRETPRLRSSGQLLRSYIYVEDIVDAYLRLAARAGDGDVRGQTFHFSSGTRASAIEITSFLCDLAGVPRPVPMRADGSLGERITPVITGTRERDVLGWTPRTDLQAGLRAAVDWYRNNLTQFEER
jgi:CDP-glucose 4,6-dehydratase